MLSKVMSPAPNAGNTPAPALLAQQATAATPSYPSVKSRQTRSEEGRSDPLGTALAGVFNYFAGMPGRRLSDMRWLAETTASIAGTVSEYARGYLPGGAASGDSAPAQQLGIADQAVASEQPGGAAEAPVSYVKCGWEEKFERIVGRDYVAGSYGQHSWKSLRTRLDTLFSLHPSKALRAWITQHGANAMLKRHITFILADGDHTNPMMQKILMHGLQTISGTALGDLWLLEGAHRAVHEESGETCYGIPKDYCKGIDHPELYEELKRVRAKSARAMLAFLEIVATHVQAHLSDSSRTALVSALASLRSPDKTGLYGLVRPPFIEVLQRMQGGMLSLPADLAMRAEISKKAVFDAEGVLGKTIERAEGQRERYMKAQYQMHSHHHDESRFNSLSVLGSRHVLNFGPELLADETAMIMIVWPKVLGQYQPGK